MSAMTTTDIQITPRDLGSTPREVAVIVCELVNKHGVRYRLQNNGGHIFLYNGETQSRPYKISASRPAETTLDFLHKWIKKNVPSYYDPEPKVTSADVAALAEKVNTEPKPVRAVPSPPKETPVIDSKTPDPNRFDPAEWEPYKYGFVTNGEIFKCTYDDCDYTRPNAQGLHLHEYIHTGESEEKRRQAAETRTMRQQQSQQMVQAALQTIAEHVGLKVENPEVEKLRAKVAEQEREIDDLKARISLIKEAMKA